MEQNANQMLSGGWGAFQARSEMINDKYYSYEGETLEELEKKVGEGVRQKKLMFFTMVILPLGLVVIMGLLKFILSIFSNIGKDAESGVSNH